MTYLLVVCLQYKLSIRVNTCCHCICIGLHCSLLTLYYSHVIQTLDIFVVKLVKFFLFLLLLDFSPVNKDFQYSLEYRNSLDIVHDSENIYVKLYMFHFLYATCNHSSTLSVKCPDVIRQGEKASLLFCPPCRPASVELQPLEFKHIRSTV